MNARSGLTLIEVIAALVLLSLVVTSTLPLLQDATRSVAEPAPNLDLFELTDLADRLLEELDVDALPAGEPHAATSSDGRPVEVQVLQAEGWEGTEDEEPHTWIVLRAGDQTILRWFAPDEEEPGDAEPGGEER